MKPALLTAAVIALATIDARASEQHARFLKALAAVESPEGKTGDNGKGLGPFQIHPSYWRCAMRHDKSLTAHGETYAHCVRYEYAARVVTAYMKHHVAHCWETGDWAFLARVHHCGPTGSRKGRGKAFARLVTNLMEAK